VEARPHRPDRAADHPGDVLVGHLLQEAEEEDLAVLGRQPVQGGVDARGVLRREVASVPGRVGQPGLRQGDEARPAPAELAEGAVARQAVQPGPQGPRVEQPGQPPEGVAPDLLERVVGAVRAAEQLAQVVPEARPVAADTPEDATADLSAACVAFGRDAAASIIR
jgi:hypothetical protein